MVNLEYDLDMRSALFVFLLSVMSFSVMAQKPHAILRSFSAVKQPNGVNLKWVIIGGRQCDGTRVFRAGEALQFELIEHIEGICGSQSDDVTYSYFDNSPKSNSYNFYRLEMGLQGFTDTVNVFFEDFGLDRYLLLSETQSQAYRILFSNDLNREATLNIYDISGRAIYQDQTIGNDFQLSSVNWDAGVYVFRISGIAEVDVAGKLYFSGR